MERSWLSIGDEFVAKVGGGQDGVAAAIDGLEWIDIPEDGSLTVAFSPGYAIKAAIREFGLPAVRRVAPYGGFSIPDADGGDGFYPALYGIEANYANGRARIFLLDTGTGLTPLCSDFEPATVPA